MSLKLHQRKNSPNWYIRGTVRGITVDESSGTANRSTADDIRIQREAEILHRSVHGARATATFLEAAVGYMEAGGERRYLKPLIDHFGATSLGRIDQGAIDAAARQIKPVAGPATRNRQVYTPMSAVLKYAAERNLCEFMPVKRPKQPKGRVRWLRQDEAENLIDACAPHLRPLVIFLFGTGARLSEALYLDWRNVDLAGRRVVFLDTKNTDHRGVPLNERVLVELANLPHRDSAVFRRPDGEPYAHREGGGGQIDTAFNAACRRAGISNFSPHGCRHTWATWLYGARRDLGELKELGGWKSDSMVLQYAHTNPDHLADAVDALPWAKSVKRDVAG